MRKWITPLVLFVAVFLVSRVCQPYTLICQEYEGLFLNTPDGWARAFSQPWPISGIISDFLIQFYREPVYGALLSALLVTLAFLLLRGIVKHFGILSDSFSALGVGVLWFFLARSSEPKLAVAVLLIGLALWLLSLLLPRKEAASWKPDLALALVLVHLAAAFTIFSPSVQKTERYSRVKRDALYGYWDDLLKAVPPSVAEKNRELTPFALLALSGKGQLGDRMFSYPVYEENDLDMVLLDDRDDIELSLFFKAVLYQYLGCFNEAVHNYYQLSTLQRKGCSFILLRKLVEMYYQLGNYTLMEKYCRILDGSLLYGDFVRQFREAAAGKEEQETLSVAIRSEVPLITHEPLYNLLLMEASGLHSQAASERILASFILRKEADGFVKAMEGMEPSYQRIPSHFQEAMLLFGMESPKIEPQVRANYESFLQDLMQLPQSAIEARYKHTAFLVYFYVVEE